MQKLGSAYVVTPIPIICQWHLVRHDFLEIVSSSRPYMYDLLCSYEAQAAPRIGEKGGGARWGKVGRA